MQEDPNKITYFAKTNSRGKEVPFGIKRKDRARHMYVIGKTGMGKSTLLENMAIQDIRNGEGMAFIDPHGSTADRIMEYVPENRIKDVVYFAPFDMDHPLAFNVMEDVGYDKRHLVVSGLLAAFRKIWVDAWSARMEYILSNTLLALLEYEGSTLLDVNRMLINKAFRKKVVENIKDPQVRSFWVEEFANYTDRYTQDATPAIQNKVGQFTSNPLIRNIVGQPKSSFDIRQLMDEKKILIMNLSKGRVGEVNATLLGSMLVTKIYLAAMSRADVTADVLAKLPSFYFYVDEFQNFANESFSDILSEARKYKLNLLIAHQYIEQMEEEVRDAVFGNVGTTVAFRVGPFDAEVLETIFNPQFTATDLVNLGAFQIYLTLMIDGIGSPPFSATSLSPFDPPPQKFVEQVHESSRRLFGKNRVEVEEVIKKWQEADPVEPAAAKPKKDYSSGGARRTESQSKPPAQRSLSPNGGSGFPQAAEVSGQGARPFARPASTAPTTFENPPTPLPVPPPPQSTQPVPPREAHSGTGQHVHQPQPMRQAVAKAMGDNVARQHGIATSKTIEDETPMPPPRPPERPREHTPKSPPLEGAKSLREALAKVTGHQAPVHAPDLKEALHTVAPKAEAKPAELPEQVLREMLAVDEDESSYFERPDK
jgi:hypothetical protein